MDDTAIFDDYVNENCGHCRASFGHFFWCPLINRNTAEAWSATHGEPTEIEQLHAKALGVKLGSKQTGGAYGD